MDPTDPRWSTLHSSPYLGVSHQYQRTQHGTNVLTPISLADSPYMQPRPSPGLSHHSQEYPYIDDTVVSQGLGITSSYHDYIPAPSSSPSFGYQHPQHHEQQQQQQTMDFYNYGSTHTGSYALELTSSKRPKRQMIPNTLSSQRNSPVRILPHPDGLQRLEHERRGGQIVDPNQQEPQKTRPAGRGRRDPQAEEEDAFVENLRAQNLSWKIVAEMFRERYGKNTSEARLQMRMLRRRKSAAAWQEADIQLLHKAYKYWQTEKFRIIADKLQDLGASQEYAEEQIQSQLKCLHDDGSENEFATTSPGIEHRELQSPRARTTTFTSRKRKRQLDGEEDEEEEED
uniref:Myb-like domain-containing protein n=1 Tax=Talaromyces marneffei PM1 TaxID=1077442 RepID=A0A093UY39_TALMA